jgi:hypothetical protein
MRLIRLRGSLTCSTRLKAGGSSRGSRRAVGSRFNAEGGSGVSSPAEGRDLIATILMKAVVYVPDGPRARTEGLITLRFPLDDYAGALDALRGDRTVHKIIIECWQQR